MRFWKLVTAGLVAWGGAAGSAHACYQVALSNESNRTVEVIWAALGCAKVYSKTDFSFNLVCGHKSVAAGSGARLIYSWGTTLPYLNVLVKSDSGKYETVEYLYHDHKFRQMDTHPETVPYCGKHYTVTFTQSDLDKLL